MKQFIAFIRSKQFLKHTIIAVLTLFLMIWGIFYSLKLFTRHGEAISLPDFRGQNIASLDSLSTAYPVKFSVMDSAYHDDKEGGIIFNQNPEPKSKVKSNRTIYISVTKFVPPKVVMPNLISLSSRQAISILEGIGLQVGEISVIPDLAKQAVINQQINGNDVEAGRRIIKNTAIDLVVGDGLSDENIPVPFLIGMTLDNAIATLKMSTLNAGGILYDPAGVKDSMKSWIYRQYPMPYNKSDISLGEDVDLWCTDDLKKVKLDSIPLP